MKIPSIVYWKNTTLNVFSICCLLLTFAVSGCGDDYSLSDDQNNPSNTGSYACSIKWPEDIPSLETTSRVSKAIDCDAAGIVTVAFTFYDGSGSYLTGDEWSCSLHEGTVYGIPIGTDRRLVVTGEDASGTVLYRGEETGIEINAGETTEGGVIEMTHVPTTTITSPSDGTIYSEGDTITFSGSGEDPEDETLTGSSLVWTSSIDGEIGTGTSFTKDDLSVGTHTITLTATDSDAATGTDSVSITVNAAGSPTATITSPSDGSTYTQGETITFTGSGEDAEDGTLTGSSLVWTSSRDDEIGTGTSFERSDLSVGTHTVTLTATDSEGATGSDSVGIAVYLNTGTISMWPSSEDVFKFDDHVGVVSNIEAQWSLGNFSPDCGWFYGYNSSTEVAHVTGISHISEITDASIYNYSSWSVGLVYEGDFVLFHNVDTGYYAAIRVDDIYGGSALVDATWYFQVNGSSSFSSFASLAPSAPENVSATPGDEEVTISWDTSSGATFYPIYWSTESGVSKDTHEGQIISVTTTAIHTGLTNGTTYYYVVTAKNEYGESDESEQVSATPYTTAEVGGIISNDTIWTLYESPYMLTSDVQIAYGVTLTIEPGVIIYGEGFGIKVWGNLNALGTDASYIAFNNLDIIPGTGGPTSELFEINVQYSDINSGSFYTVNSGYGNLVLRDSILQDIPYMHLWYPGADCYIERNIFLNSGGISVGIEDDIKVYIRNNVFYQQTGGNGKTYAVENWAGYSTSETIVEYNSFLSTDRVALMLPSGMSSARMTAINNYWNTTDESVIESMIFDKNDDLGAADYIVYNPFLSSPDTNTPDPSTYIP